MEALEIKTIFTLTVLGFEIPITETVVVSWAIMLALIIASVILTRKLKTVPTGPQVILEFGIGFLNNFAKKFGPFTKFLSPYMGSLFLFLLVANLVGLLSPVEFKFFGREFTPPFFIRPPTRDINVTAAFAMMSITLVLILGLLGRGIVGWIKHLFYPVPLMLPFNLMDFGIRPLSLALRLYGNILAGVVMMSMLEGVIPVVIPAVASIYFDLFDGIMQAGIFVFLTSFYISEAVQDREE